MNVRKKATSLNDKYNDIPGTIEFKYEGKIDKIKIKKSRSTGDLTSSELNLVVIRNEINSKKTRNSDKDM
jgi:hypothetical protein